MRTPLWLALVLLVGAARGESASTYRAMAPVDRYLIADRNAEIALARSAAPPSISTEATVLVLGRHGYETAVKGSNGFVCFVERSWMAYFSDSEFWNPKTRAPNCFNPPAAASVLPVYVKRTEWVLAGLDRAQLIARARAAFEAHRIRTPEAGSFSFMLSRQGYLGDQAGGPWLPHVMFFVAPRQVVNWAAGLEASPVVGQPGDPFEPTVLFIPVRRWSDGSPAPLAADLRHKM
ncbi:MAG TPA: hypothetical protein VGH15_00325 [Caulobacteraceae bacterium]|jgi:hypothetical protein